MDTQPALSRSPCALCPAPRAPAPGRGRLKLNIKPFARKATGVAGRGASARDMPALTKAGWTRTARHRARAAPRAPAAAQFFRFWALAAPSDADRSARKSNSSLDITQRIVLHGVRASERAAGSFLAQQDLAQL